MAESPLTEIIKKGLQRGDSLLAITKQLNDQGIPIGFISVKMEANKLLAKGEI